MLDKSRFIYYCTEENEKYSWFNNEPRYIQVPYYLKVKDGYVIGEKAE